MGSERRERMRALGMRLRGLRTEAGLTGAVLAQRAGVGQPTVSKVETGRMVPSTDVLDRLSQALDLDESTAREVRDLLAAVEAAADAGPVSGEDAPAGAVLDEAVRSARLVRSFQCVVLPAMLQSAEYARHVFESAPNSTPEAVGRAVAARVERQSVLYEPGRESVFVLTEAVLRTWPGTPALMLAQLDRLLAVESLSTVRLGVVPWRRPVPLLPRHGFTLCDRRAVVVEAFAGEQVSVDPAELAAYEATFSRFERAAVFGDEVRDLLLRVMKEFRDLGDTVTP
ncbi:XRE family transcriptional regulator [Streptomyces sp. WAC05374]|uniref:helix-turn-helix domain-containing protein n=1 Tax=Streptomyces sp. WAC05374 TaxID=2487420 RepID=UPI000F8809FA|nr:helix-turn-helix transcriptional regulator [Streptomyces sp. WAC05374]RST11128.1 XRE family transcriptional regulator [Streptomyces sp. WAC05374]TDF47119.1 XRE family transcriptional regulator [Streptomyces sp. WAC05374]TDF57377.1 XRE family transcriptional regulator [Streptomyces sp. WAC05374]TDF61482.1 XRE family transcriptional regulator [Streptomyces sp. WAC05374]